LLKITLSRDGDNETDHSSTTVRMASSINSGHYPKPQEQMLDIFSQLK